MLKNELNLLVKQPKAVQQAFIDNVKSGKNALFEYVEDPTLKPLTPEQLAMVKRVEAERKERAETHAPGNLAEIQLKRTDKGWLLQWSTNGQRFYFINYNNVRFPPNSAVEHSADYARNALNAVIMGLIVRVKGGYDKATRILTIQP